MKNGQAETDHEIGMYVKWLFKGYEMDVYQDERPELSLHELLKYYYQFTNAYDVAKQDAPEAFKHFEHSLLAMKNELKDSICRKFRESKATEKAPAQEGFTHIN